ncbi:metallophosphoesterase [Agromyces aerolatus]|uniref:metallophosphoesterase n=1 Tax=Agromyces sp. LY-1074 TaxID=3074080 RepID=UPI0028577BBD|nr:MULTISPECIES: metallophosphoesterase [unclassified Agromyces]MDR5701880.1 metallophosphoesterase [Agromyces sp. LY-1074]MDR5708106.1 metallophosphoesterase [Agromyces sp. LY-1358]
MPQSRLRRFTGTIATATACAVGLALLTAPPAHAASQTSPLLITEIAADNVGADHFEYFEVHNTTPDAINLAASGIEFSYVTRETTDLSIGTKLAVEGDVTIAGGETAVLWLSYRAESGSPDSFQYTVDDFRQHFGMDQTTQIARITGQPGMANGGSRAVRVAQGDQLLSYSFYPTGSMGQDLVTHFRLPADPAALNMDVLAQLAPPSPGVIDPAQLTPTEPEPEPLPEPGPASSWPLMVTEITPDNVSHDHFEFFEVANTTNEPIDLAAGGYSFAYSYVNTPDRTRDIPLVVADETLVIEPRETIVFWLSYTAGSVDSSAKTEADFRAHFGMTSDARIVRVSGQNGIANGGDRGIRVLQGDQIVSWSHVPAGGVGQDLSANFRIPGDVNTKGMQVLETLATPTPGIVAAEAFTAPPFSPEPDPTIVTSRLQVTELMPDTNNVGGADAYEFIEVYNATSEPIDFADYTVNYLHMTGAEVLWPAQPADIVIPGGGTLVLWIKNGANTHLTAADFNAEFGTDLTLGEDLAEISSGGMANGSPRGIEIMTNTGFTVNQAQYNMVAGVDDTFPDRSIRYGIDAADQTVQRLLGLDTPTPGRVQADQVPSGLMIEASDTTLPVVEDRNAAEIDPTVDFVPAFHITDDVQVRTVTMTLTNDVDPGARVLNLTPAEGDVYRHRVHWVDLAGKAWFEYTLEVSDGTNTYVSEPRRLPVAGVDTDPVRFNLDEGQFVSGDTRVVATSDAYPNELELTIDGETVETEPMLETAPVFAFEAERVDNYFKNGVKVGDDVLQIFEKGIYVGSETIVTPIPLEYIVEGRELVVSIWAGTKAAPEIDLEENNDDFGAFDPRLILPDGRTLIPAGYEGGVLEMGDSAGKLDFYEARFELPADAFTGLSHTWETASVEDGAHTLTATDRELTATRTVHVDNTAPVVTSSVVDGTPYQGPIRIEADVADAGSGVASATATLDGTAIELPYETSSLDLAPGDHVLEILATDVVGNSDTYTATFTTYDEYPSAGIIGPLEGSEVEAGDVTLQARVEDPTGDTLQVSFREGHRLELGDGDVKSHSGTVSDAASTDRGPAQSLSRDEVQTLTGVDGLATEISSDEQFPFQMFDVDVPAGTAADSLVRVEWAGSANPGAQVMLYALDPSGSSWTEIDRHLTAGTEAEAFGLDGVVEAGAYARDGVVTILVQHSEGFAGENLTERDSPVEPANPADVPRSQYDFTIGWESDTQYYNATHYTHQVSIHDYLLDRREEINLQYVIHTGDIVDNHTVPQQWTNADAQYLRFDKAELPYGVLAGNHDVGYEVDYTAYGQVFGEARYADNPWYGGSYEDNRGHYDLISSGGIDFLMLYMGWGPADAELAWMNEVLAAHPERIAIINLHENVLPSGGLGPVPQRIQDEVVAPNPNVKMVLSGHYHDAATRTDTFDDDGDGVADRTVYSMLFDYQGLPEGGQGFFRMLHFDNETQQMLVRTYSHSLGQYNSDDPTLAGPPEDPYADQEFEISYAQLGIAPQTRTLATDAFSAEILTSNEIAAFADVPSGSVLTATWPLTELGEHGWYVQSADPFGAVDYSGVSRFTVIPAAEEPGEPGEEPGGPGEEPGGPGEEPGGPGGPGQPGEPGGPGTGGPGAAKPAGTGSGGELADTGSPIDAGLAWTIGGLAALVMALGALLMLRTRSNRRGEESRPVA